MREEVTRRGGAFGRQSPRETGSWNKERNERKRSSQFWKTESLREGVLVCRSERTREKKGSVCGNSRSKSVLVIQNEQTKELSFEKSQWAFERLPARRGFYRERDGSRASRREGRRGDAGASDDPCSHQRLNTFAGAQDLDLGLVL